MRNLTFSALLSFALIFSLTACNGEDTPDAELDMEDEQIEQRITAVAELEPTEDFEAEGRVTFTQEDGGVRVEGQVRNLPGDGPHGFHVHEDGDCSAPDATSAGDHYNPHDSPHGGPDDAAEDRHMGDLGNIEADEDGEGTYQRVDEVLELEGQDSIIGRAVVIHEGEDDLTTQPSGDAGDRVACGVIERGPDASPGPDAAQPDE